MEDKYTVEIFFILPGKPMDSDFWSVQADRRKVAWLANHCVFLHRKYCDLSAFFAIYINGKRTIVEDPHNLINIFSIRNHKKPVLDGQK